MALKCRWQFCNQQFEIIEDLECHACFHSIDVAKESDEKFQFACQWSGCNRLVCENLGDPVNLPRHILRHCLEEHLIMVAKQIVGAAECDELPLSAYLPEQEFSCRWKDCSFKSESGWNYYDHAKSHLQSDNEKPIRCQWAYCCKLVDQGESAMDHMKEHTQEPYAMCESCRRLFSSADQVNAHFKVPNHYKCRWLYCGSVCNGIESLETHVTDHVRDPDLYQPCAWKDCGWQFPGTIRSDEDKGILQRNLHSHLLRHTYSVERCHYAKSILSKSKYSSLQTCKWHANRDQNTFDKELPEQDTFSCKWKSCQKTFLNPRLYFIHVAKHVPTCKDEDPPYSCRWKENSWSNACDVKCATRVSLQRHLQVHTNEYKLQCEVCHFVFKASNVFAEHLMSQTGSIEKKEHKHVCPECKRRFASRHYLQSHSRSHKKEFICVTCQEVFPTEYAMRKHCRLTHQRSAYRCTFCPKKFNGKKIKEYASKDSLNRHIKNAHMKEVNGESSSDGEFIYVCSEPLCGYSTRQPDQYRNHWLSCHSAETNRYLCHLCYSIFDKSIKLTTHLKNVHSLTPKPPYEKFSYELCDDGLFKLSSEAGILKNL